MSKGKKKTPRKNEAKKNNIFPDKFPFWARLKIAKERTTLVIDEDLAKDKSKGGKLVDGYVHREATHENKRGDNEEVYPNPDENDSKPMYLKRPKKTPKRLFEPHNKKLKMPDFLRRRYDKNNHKNK